MPARPLRHHQRRAQPGRQPADPVPGGPLAGAGRLDLLRRPPPDSRTASWSSARRLLAVFPFVGTIVYSILRPPEFLADKRERELEIRASELRVRQLEEAVVPELRAPGRAQLPALPELPRPDQGPVRVVRQADRPALVDLPLLRDPGAPRRAAAGAPSAPSARAAEARGRPRRPERAAEGQAPAESRVVEAPSAPPSLRAPARPRARVRRRDAAAASPARSTRERRTRLQPPTRRRPDPAPRAAAARTLSCRADGETSRTLILIKPDAFERGLTGEVLARFERKGLRIVDAAADDGRRGDRQPPLRRARREAVLRRAGLVHHRRPAGRRGARGPRGRRRGPPADRRHQPGRGRAGLDPRRLRPRGHLQPRPRLGLRRVRRARDRDLVPGSAA